MIERNLFGILDGGKEIYAYTLKNEAGMSVKIITFGGAIVELRTPDKFGRMTDIVAGYDSIRDYALADGYLGALVGRTSNRIGKGTYSIDGKEYRVYCNDGKNSLHGGKVGYSYRIWNAEAKDSMEPELVMTLHSPDGEEGYPGNVDVTVTYKLTADNALSIHYVATTDKKTIINLTNHAYFNLGGFASGSIEDTVLQMDADRFLPTDKELIPTGEIRKVTGTPFDFREPKTIGRDINENYTDLVLGGGYDHCFCFEGGETKEPVLRLEAYHENTGRIMKMYTNQPCVQLYTGNMFENAEFQLKGGCPRRKRGAFCLETQKMPDAINQKGFDDITLNPGETYDYTTVYQFSVKQ